MMRFFQQGELDAHTRSREIMGINFVGIPEIIKLIGAFDGETEKALDRIPFSETTLIARAETHLLVADIGLSMEEMRSGLFHRGNQELDLHRSHPAWRLICKTEVMESWAEELRLLGVPEEALPTLQLTHTAILLLVAKG